MYKKNGGDNLAAYRGTYYNNVFCVYLKNIKVGVTYNLMDTKQSFIYKFREISHNNVTGCLSYLKTIRNTLYIKKFLERHTKD